MIRPVPRSGFTLVELLVVIALFGIMAGIVAVGARFAAAPGRADEGAAEVAAARRAALDQRRAVTIEVRVGGRRHEVTAFPDGSVAADPALGVDPFTGRSHARR